MNICTKGVLCMQISKIAGNTTAWETRSLVRVVVRQGFYCMSNEHSSCFHRRELPRGQK